MSLETTINARRTSCNEAVQAFVARITFSATTAAFGVLTTGGVP
jgi:hypothetical protein